MKRFSFSSLRFRLLLLVILASIPAILLTVNHAIEDRNAATTRIHTETVQLTQLTVANQEHSIEGTRQLLVALGNLPSVRNHNSTECSEFMAQIHKNYPHYANIFADTPDGDQFCSAVPMKEAENAAERAWFQRAVSSREFAIGDYQVGPVSGVSIIVAAYPVYDENGSLQAVVSASLDLAWINEQAVKMQLSPGATFRIIDQKGTILVRIPDPEMWVGKSVSELGIIKTQLSQHEGTTEDSGVDGVRRFFAFAPVHSGTSETGLFVSNGMPVSIAVAQVNNILIRDITGLSIAIFLMLLIAWFVSDAFVLRHVNKLLSVTERVSKGDLSVRTGLTYNSGEVGELARVFDGMVESLQEKEAQRKEAEDALKKSRSMLLKAQEIGHMGSWEWDLTTHDLTWSREVYIIYGLDPELGMPKYDTVINTLAPECKDDFLKAIDDALKLRKPFDGEYILIRPNGTRVNTHTRGEVVFDSKGQPVRMYGIVQDITERKRAEEELKKYHEHLEELVKERTAQLNIKNEELERFNKLFVGRELRMIELKKKIAELENDINRMKKTDQSKNNGSGT